jgi:hypothetical protein
MRKKLTDIEKYQRKLKRLIDNIPEGYMLCYDMGICEVYVVDKKANFIEKPKSNSGTSWHGVLTPVSEPDYDEGFDKDYVIGDGIYIEMAAVEQ